MVPHICEPLTTQPIDKCLELHPHISQLDLADDPMDETREIDMLIGLDFYWEFVTGEVVRGGEGPVAINTTVGWTSQPHGMPCLQVSMYYTIHVTTQDPTSGPSVLCPWHVTKWAEFVGGISYPHLYSSLLEDCCGQ